MNQEEQTQQMLSGGQIKGVSAVEQEIARLRAEAAALARLLAFVKKHKGEKELDLTLWRLIAARHRK